ncbi:hypothetical protein BT96DRAFT_776302, partial [Gymnopus androsaceus JB14]
FGFIDPASVIHAAHLIPNTASGTTSDALPAQSIARRPDEDDEDWEWYNVNYFPDRDMFFHYIGFGVGHHN